MEYQIKHRDDLLVQLAEKTTALIKAHPRAQFVNVEVTFHVQDQQYSFDYERALQVLVEDLFWDERGNWSDVEDLTVETR